uniref:ATP synthase F0 subunit 8 n=1 Tax=Ampittia subvittatus TaxID=2573046 RepID=UPI0022FD3B53|nr:ATP synthase F0 subunit 8 [Ampittia subvittatus]WAW79826.1 ATP synthase F0 subunit 8 [Ampittia subvittatus]
MPQMMPINWIISLFLFILIFIIFNILNYYIFIIKSNKTDKNQNFKKNMFYWKW